MGITTGGTAAEDRSGLGRLDQQVCSVKGQGAKDLGHVGHTVCEATSAFMKAAVHERKEGGQVPIYKIEQRARFVLQASVGRPPGLVCCNPGSTRPHLGWGAQAQATPGNADAIHPSGSCCVFQFWAPSQKGQWETSGGQPPVHERKMYNSGKQIVHLKKKKEKSSSSTSRHTESSGIWFCRQVKTRGEKFLCAQCFSGHSASHHCPGGRYYD